MSNGKPSICPLSKQFVLRPLKKNDMLFVLEICLSVKAGMSDVLLYGLNKVKYIIKMLFTESDSKLKIPAKSSSFMFCGIIKIEES